MGQTLRALFVDDNPVDVELERAALRHDFAVDGPRVETAEAFTAALQSGDWDVILCDYTMPHFSGMDALALWRAAGMSIAFIFVTGNLTEEVAVECIKAGATDYVLKGNLARLPMAVDRALREFAAARALRQTEAERARIAAAVDQAEEVVIITDPTGRIVYVNPAFTRVTGYRPEEAINQTPRLLKSGRQDAAFYAGLWRKISAGEVWRGELINRRRDGTFYDAELTLAPVLNATGKIVNFCAIQRDVSARVAAERELRALNARLAETDRLKDEFLAAFSHELRTPLNIIVGYADVLRETRDAGLDAESRKFLERIARSAEHLTTLINATLDLARLRIGRIDVEFGAVDVAALTREVADTFTPLAASKGLTLSCVVPAAPIEATTDAMRLRQVLSNLIDNAIKFTACGEIHVRAAGDDGAVSLEVRDTGIGVAPEDVPRIFEDFRQLDGSSTRRFGGCGLGLALTKRLLRVLGGSIEVESELGRGSCFRVRLPRTRAVAGARAAAEPN